jgi:hypothetical protein
MASARRAVAFVIATLAACLITCSQSVAAAYTPLPVKHVWVIDLENESLGYTFGPTGHEFAPYLTETLRWLCVSGIRPYDRRSAHQPWADLAGIRAGHG